MAEEARTSPNATPPAAAPPPRFHLPLTTALIRAGLGGLSMGTPGHRGGRLFGAWEALDDAKLR